MRTRQLRIAAVVIILLAWLGVANAQKVHVKGYVRKDGTVVQPYDRSKPKSGTSTGSTSDTTGGSSGAKSGSSGGTKATKNKPLPPPPAVSSTTRDEDGHLKRSEAQKQKFMKQTGFPKGRPGYVVDHVVALACGGADTPSNMQWQSVEAAKAKDKVERKGCSSNTNPKR